MDRNDEYPQIRVMALHALLYCERLFYLEEVEEIRVADAAVWAGRRLHVELDEPDEVVSLTMQSVTGRRTVRLSRRPRLCSTKWSLPSRRRIASTRPRIPSVSDEGRNAVVAAINEGWLYLAVIIDLFSRRVVGKSMGPEMPTELVLDALRAALGSRKPSELGLIFHSDRGCQYASQEFRRALANAGIACSMSRKGDCWDNAVAESFFSTLKTELVYRNTFLTKEHARLTISEWIEVFYNRQRRHSTLGYETPVEFEQRYYASTSNVQGVVH